MDLGDLVQHVVELSRTRVVTWKCGLSKTEGGVIFTGAGR